MAGCTETHSNGGVPVSPALQGFEACQHDLVLQLDVDLLFAGPQYEPVLLRRRSGSSGGSSGSGGSNTYSGSPAMQNAATEAWQAPSLMHETASSTLLQLACILQGDPAAISISLPSLPHPPVSSALPSSAFSRVRMHGARSSGFAFSASYINSATRAPWRTEVRGCLLHRARLMQLLPLPAGEQLALWLSLIVTIKSQLWSETNYGCKLYMLAQLELLAAQWHHAGRPLPSGPTWLAASWQHCDSHKNTQELHCRLCYNRG